MTALAVLANGIGVQDRPRAARSPCAGSKRMRGFATGGGGVGAPTAARSRSVHFVQGKAVVTHGALFQRDEPEHEPAQVDDASTDGRHVFKGDRDGLVGVLVALAGRSWS